MLKTSLTFPKQKNRMILFFSAYSGCYDNTTTQNHFVLCVKYDFKNRSVNLVGIGQHHSEVTPYDLILKSLCDFQEMVNTNYFYCPKSMSVIYEIFP